MSAATDQTLSNSQSLAGKTALVTGGANGIGRATARQLAEAGARVFVADVKHLDENQDLFADLGIEPMICDVRHEAEIQKVVDEVVGRAGRLDILVNNAGVGLVKQIVDVAEEEWDNVLDVNLKGPFFGSKHAIRHMIDSGNGGVIVNTASNAGLLPRAHDPVYSISKMALVALTKSLALCHGKDNIRVNAVCPGPVCETGMMDDDLETVPDREAAIQGFIAASPIATAQNRMIVPDEVAAAIMYLVSDQAAMVTGTCIAIDGGKSQGVPPKVG